MDDVFNDPGLQNEECMVYNQDRNIHTSGDELLGHPFYSPDVGVQAKGLEFRAEQPGGMGSAPNDELGMPLPAHHEMIFNQASVDYGMEDIGRQANAIQPPNSRHGVNTQMMSSGSINPADPRQRADGLYGQDTEYSDFLDNGMESDLVGGLSPDMRPTLALQDDAAKTQVSTRESFRMPWMETVVLNVTSS